MGVNCAHIHMYLFNPVLLSIAYCDGSFSSDGLSYFIKILLQIKDKSLFKVQGSVHCVSKQVRVAL